MTEAHPDALQQFWTRTPEAMCTELHCGRDGLSTTDAEARLGRYGPNADAVAKRVSVFGAITRRLLESKLKSMNDLGVRGASSSFLVSSLF